MFSGFVAPVCFSVWASYFSGFLPTTMLRISCLVPLLSMDIFRWLVFTIAVSLKSGCKSAKSSGGAQDGVNRKLTLLN